MLDTMSACIPKEGSPLEIPIEFVLVAISLIGVLASRSIFGIISRNKIDSDLADVAVKAEIKELREEIKQNQIMYLKEFSRLEAKFTANDRDLYEKHSGVKGKQLYDQGFRDGKSNA